jgi:xylulokinase
MGFLLGLDIGTTTIKAILYDPESRQLVRQAAQPTPVEHPTPELSQHDPQLLWQAVCRCLQEISHNQTIDALAISSFAEAGLPLDDQGRPLYPIIAWFDQRTTPQADWWKTQMTLEELYAITGQRLSPSFGVNKLLWIREHHPQAIIGMRRWLSSSDFILFNLTGEYVTDYSQASRTMLFDQRQLTWSEKMLDFAGLKWEHLPNIQCAGTLAGRMTPEAASQTGLPQGLPCVLGGHDHLCAALAAGAIRPGIVIDSMGTSQSALVVVKHFQTNPEVVRHGFVCYAHVVPNLYILKAGIHAAGGAIDWLAGLLSAKTGQGSPIPYEELEKEAQTGVGKTIGPLWLPHFIGSGTPEMDWNSRAALVGAKLNHTRGDILRGLWESQAFWLKHNLDEICQLSGQSIEQIILLGGTTRLKLLTQLKASILNMPMLLPSLSESAATGAALLAGLGIGTFKTSQEAVYSLKVENKVIEPEAALIAWYQPIYEKVYRLLYPGLKEIWANIAELEEK